MKAQETGDIVLRYFFLVGIAAKNLWLFYVVLTPLTLVFSALFLEPFFDVAIIGNFLVLDGVAVEINKACVAGAAYYLLLALNLTTRNIKIKKRIAMLLFSFAALFFLNVTRIAVLGAMIVKGAALFDITHKIFWYGISTAFVVAIWLFSVKLFAIRDIPFLSDFKYLLKAKKGKKRKRRKNTKYVFCYIKMLFSCS